MPAVFELIKEPHLIDVTEVCEHHEVSVDAGLSHHAVIERQAQHGLNELPRAEVVPAWKKFFAQFNDTLILILIGAAVVSAVISQEIKTPLVVLVVVLANAIIGFFQEHKAEAALEALRSMVIGEAKVRRDGEVRMVPMHEIVPGDIVLVEAGDRIPADGRLLVAANLEIEEAALTGESQPVVKMDSAIDLTWPSRTPLLLADEANSLPLQLVRTPKLARLPVFCVKQVQHQLPCRISSTSWRISSPNLLVSLLRWLSLLV